MRSRRQTARSADRFASNPPRELRLVLVLQDQIADPRPAANFIKRQRGVDQPQVIGQVIGIAGQEHAVVVRHPARGQRIDVPHDVRRAVVAQRVVKLRMVVQAG